jgi:FKBP-type peptidyl-prolyl cis-trans isomerase FklB
MKRLIASLLGASLVIGVSAYAAGTLQTDQDKLSYSMGVMTGKAFKDHQIQVSPQAFSMGLDDGYAAKKPLLTDAQMHQILANFQQQSMIKMQAQMKQAATENAKKGQDFLTENKSKPGVMTTADGLQYKVIKSGTGESPSVNDTVTVNYEGRLLDGKVFDSSYQRGKPVTFPVNGVIKGWQEALVMMKPGDERELYIPAELAYGAQGAPGVIGPNETLIFKVNLISVQKKK